MNILSNGNCLAFAKEIQAILLRHLITSLDSSLKQRVNTITDELKKTLIGIRFTRVEKVTRKIKRSESRMIYDVVDLKLTFLLASPWVSSIEKSSLGMTAEIEAKTSCYYFKRSRWSWKGDDQIKITTKWDSTEFQSFFFEGCSGESLICLGRKPLSEEDLQTFLTDSNEKVRKFALDQVERQKD